MWLFVTKGKEEMKVVKNLSKTFKCDLKNHKENVELI